MHVAQVQCLVSEHIQQQNYRRDPESNARRPYKITVLNTVWPLKMHNI